MKVKIVSLTKSTIVFNKIGIIIHGNCTTNNIAIVDIINEDQEKELKELQNAKLISVVSLDEVKPTRSRKEKTSNKLPDILSESNKSVIMSGDKPIIVDSKKIIEENFDDSQLKDSLEAAKKLDEEREGDDKECEEMSKKAEEELKEQEKMGQDTVVVVGRNKIKKEKMKKSLVDDQEDRPSPFIDEKDAKSEKENKKVKKAFVDKDDIKDGIDDDDKLSDAFIEL